MYSKNFDMRKVTTTNHPTDLSEDIEEAMKNPTSIHERFVYHPFLAYSLTHA